MADPVAQMIEPRPIAASLAILSAMVLIGYIDNYVTVIAETGGLWQFHAVRALMAVPILVVVALLARWSLSPKNWRAVIGRSFFVSAAMVLYFGSLAFLPIAQSVAGLFSAPMFVLLISSLLPGQTLGRVRIAAVAVGFAGVLLVLQPWSDRVSVWSALAVLAGLFYALGAMATWHWCAREATGALVMGSFVALGIWGALGMILLTLHPLPAPAGPDGFVLRGWVPPSGAFLFWTAVQAVGSLLAVALITRAYQWGETSYVAVFEYSLLIFVTVWAFVLRGEVPSHSTLAGIALIIAAGAAMALRGRGGNA